MAEPLVCTGFRTVAGTIAEWEDTTQSRVTNIEGTYLTIVALFTVGGLDTTHTRFTFIHGTIQAIVTHGWSTRQTVPSATSIPIRAGLSVITSD